MMDKYSNVYIGLVVNNSDPKQRGRVQVFIPHITNTLYKGWNDTSIDKKFRTLDSDNFPLEIVQKLVDILPWAEVAMPFFGGGTGAPIDETGTPRPIPTFTYGSTGGITPSTSKPVEHPKLDGINNTAGILSNSTSSTPTTSNSDKDALYEFYMMRVAAAEAGVTGSPGEREMVDKEITTPELAVGYSYGATTDAFAVGARKIADGTVDWNKVDIGFGQFRQGDVQTFKFVNSGTYAEQIKGSAQGLKNYLNFREADKDFRDGAIIRDAIERGDFATADRYLNNYWFGLARPTGKEAIQRLENNVLGKYNGNINDALTDINNQINPTGTITEIAKKTGKPIDNSLKPQNIIARTTNSVQNVKTGTNSTGVAGGPIGISSIPQIGSKAYVMFLDGNPLQPIVIGCYKEPTNT